MESTEPRRARTPLRIAAFVTAVLATLAVVVLVLASTVFGDLDLFGSRTPSGAADAAMHAIAKHDDGALARQLDRTGQTNDPGKGARKDEARAAIAFFRGWQIEGEPVRDLAQIDDNWYLFHFVIREQSTGRRATVRANLIPQENKLGSAWRLGSLWIPGPKNHHNKSIL